MALKVAILDLETHFPHITSLFRMSRHHVLAVGTSARQAGHSVDVFIEALNGLPSDALWEYDVVGAAVTFPNLSRVKNLFSHIRRINPRATLICGGPHATLSPHEILHFADVAVREEGETAIEELLAALEGRGRLEDIPGISFMRKGRAVHNPRRSFLTVPGIVEDFSLLLNFNPRSIPLRIRGRLGFFAGYAVTSRGCPFPCTFCYENMIGGTGHRTSSVDIFIEDVRRKRDFFGVRHFWLADSNFGTNPRHCREILQALIRANLGCTFTVLCRTDIAKWPDILDLMSQAGFSTLMIGMEAIDDESLATVHKRQTVGQIIDAVNRIHEFGLTVVGLFMVGFDDDHTDRTADSYVSFCQDHHVDGISILCFWEYPALPGRTVPRYRICETNPDYYTGHFVTIFPHRARPSVLERSVYRALNRFYSPSRILANWFSGSTRHGRFDLPFQAALSFQYWKLSQLSHDHQHRLEEIEAPYYDSQDRLRRDYLLAHPVVGEPLESDLHANWPDAREGATLGLG